MANIFTYTKNIAKSIGYATIDKIEELNPTLKELKENNQELSKEVFSAIKDFRGTARKAKEYAIKTDLYEAAEVGFHAVFEDIRTGKFYNRERISEMETRAGGELTSGWDFDDDPFAEIDRDDEKSSSSDDDWGDFDDLEKALDENTEATIKVVDKVGGKVTEGIAMATAQSAESISKTNINIAQKNQLHNEFLVNKLNVGLGSVSGAIAQLIDFNNKTIHPFVEGSLKWQSDVVAAQNKTNSLLEQIIANQNKMISPPEEQKKRDKATFESVGEVPDIKEYFRMVQQNIGQSTGGMFDMFDREKSGLGNMFLTFASSPLQFIPQYIVNTLMPKAVEKASKNFNENLEGAFSAFIAKMNTWADADEMESSPVTRYLGKILGAPSASRIKSSPDVRGISKKAIPWDEQAKTALTRVIPDALARIEAAITRRKEAFYDYNTGRYTTVAELEEKYNPEKLVEKSALSATRDFIEPIREALESFRIDDADLQRGLNDALKEMAVNMFRSDIIPTPEKINKLIREEKNWELEQLLGYSGSDDRVKDAITGIISALGDKGNDGLANDKEFRTAIMNMNKAIFSEKSRLSKTMTDLETPGNVALNLHNNYGAGMYYDDAYTLRENRREFSSHQKMRQELDPMRDFQYSSLSYQKNILDRLTEIHQDFRNGHMYLGGIDNVVPVSLQGINPGLDNGNIPPISGDNIPPMISNYSSNRDRGWRANNTSYYFGTQDLVGRLARDREKEDENIIRRTNDRVNEKSKQGWVVSDILTDQVYDNMGGNDDERADRSIRDQIKAVTLSNIQFRQFREMQKEYKAEQEKFDVVKWFKDATAERDENGKIIHKDEKDKTLLDGVLELSTRPAEFLAGVINKVDQRLYEVLFGDPDEETLQAKSFMGQLTTRMGFIFRDFSGFLKDEIFAPIKETLFGTTKEKAKEKAIELLKDKLGITDQTAMDFLFGKQDENGKRAGGMFGAQIDFAKTSWKDVYSKLGNYLVPGEDGKYYLNETAYNKAVEENLKGKVRLKDKDGNDLGYSYKEIRDTLNADIVNDPQKIREANTELKEMIYNQYGRYELTKDMVGDNQWDKANRSLIDKYSTGRDENGEIIWKNNLSLSDRNNLLQQIMFKNIMSDKVESGKKFKDIDGYKLTGLADGGNSLFEDLKTNMENRKLFYYKDAQGNSINFSDTDAFENSDEFQKELAKNKTRVNPVTNKFYNEEDAKRYTYYKFYKDNTKNDDKLLDKINNLKIADMEDYGSNIINKINLIDSLQNKDKSYNLDLWDKMNERVGNTFDLSDPKQKEELKDMYVNILKGSSEGSEQMQAFTDLVNNIISKIFPSKEEIDKAEKEYKRLLEFRKSQDQKRDEESKKLTETADKFKEISGISVEQFKEYETALSELSAKIAKDTRKLSELTEGTDEYNLLSEALASSKDTFTNTKNIVKDITSDDDKKLALDTYLNQKNIFNKKENDYRRVSKKTSKAADRLLELKSRDEDLTTDMIEKSRLGKAAQRAGYIDESHEFSTKGSLGAAEGGQVKKTGMVALSEGELVIPAKYNPYYHGPKSMAQGKKKERKAIDRYLGYQQLAEGGTVDSNDSDITPVNPDDFRNGFMKRLLLSTRDRGLGYVESFRSDRKKARNYNALNSTEQAIISNHQKGTIAYGNLTPYIQQLYDEGDFKGVLASLGKLESGIEEVAEDNDPKEYKNRKEKLFKGMLDDVGGDFGSYFPNMLGSSLIGSGVSLLTGAVGGPLLGAAIGAGTSLITQSEGVKDWLFGEIDENGERKGNIISKDLANNIGKYLPAMAKGGTVGAITSILPFVPGGPVAGVVLGSALGFASKSEKIQNTLFGYMDEEHDEWHDGILPKDFLSKLQGVVPDAVLGALGGAAGTLLVGGPFGLVGNMALGSAFGLLSSTEMFQDAIFGKVDPATGIRQGGIVGAIKTGFADPLIQSTLDLKDRFINWFKKDIAEPLSSAIMPLAKNGGLLFNMMANSISKLVGDKFSNELGSGFARYSKFLESAMTNITKGMIGTASFLARPTGAMLSAPARLLGYVGEESRKSHIASGNATYMTAKQRTQYRQELKDNVVYEKYKADEWDEDGKLLHRKGDAMVDDLGRPIIKNDRRFKILNRTLHRNQLKRHGKRRDKYEQFDEMLMNMNKEDLEQLRSDINYLKDPNQESKRQRAKTVNTLNDVIYNKYGLSYKDSQAILDRLKNRGLREAKDYIMKMGMSETDERNLFNTLEQQYSMYKAADATLTQSKAYRNNLYGNLRSRGLFLNQGNLDEHLKYLDQEINEKSKMDPIDKLNDAQQERHKELMDVLKEGVENIKALNDPEYQKDLKERYLNRSKYILEQKGLVGRFLGTNNVGRWSNNNAIWGKDYHMEYEQGENGEDRFFMVDLEGNRYEVDGGGNPINPENAPSTIKDYDPVTIRGVMKNITNIPKKTLQATGAWNWDKRTFRPIEKTLNKININTKDKMYKSVVEDYIDSIFSTEFKEYKQQFISRGDKVPDNALLLFLEDKYGVAVPSYEKAIDVIKENENIDLMRSGMSYGDKNLKEKFYRGEIGKALGMTKITDKIRLRGLFKHRGLRDAETGEELTAEDYYRERLTEDANFEGSGNIVGEEADILGKKKTVFDLFGNPISVIRGKDGRWIKDRSDSENKEAEIAKETLLTGFSKITGLFTNFGKDVADMVNRFFKIDTEKDGYLKRLLKYGAGILSVLTTAGALARGKTYWEDTIKPGLKNWYEEYVYPKLDFLINPFQKKIADIAVKLDSAVQSIPDAISSLGDRFRNFMHDDFPGIWKDKIIPFYKDGLGFIKDLGEWIVYHASDFTELAVKAAVRIAPAIVTGVARGLTSFLTKDIGKYFGNFGLRDRTGVKESEGLGVEVGNLLDNAGKKVENLKGFSGFTRLAGAIGVDKDILSNAALKQAGYDVSNYSQAAFNGEMDSSYSIDTMEGYGVLDENQYSGQGSRLRRYRGKGSGLKKYKAKGSGYTTFDMIKSGINAANGPQGPGYDPSQVVMMEGLNNTSNLSADSSYKTSNMWDSSTSSGISLYRAQVDYETGLVYSANGQFIPNAYFDPKTKKIFRYTTKACLKRYPNIQYYHDLLLQESLTNEDIGFRSYMGDLYDATMDVTNKSFRKGDNGFDIAAQNAIATKNNISKFARDDRSIGGRLFGTATIFSKDNPLGTGMMRSWITGNKGAVGWGLNKLGNYMSHKGIIKRALSKPVLAASKGINVAADHNIVGAANRFTRNLNNKTGSLLNNITQSDTMTRYLEQFQNAVANNAIVDEAIKNNDEVLKKVLAEGVDEDAAKSLIERIAKGEATGEYLFKDTVKVGERLDTNKIIKEATENLNRTAISSADEIVEAGMKGNILKRAAIGFNHSMNDVVVHGGQLGPNIKNRLSGFFKSFKESIYYKQIAKGLASNGISEKVVQEAFENGSTKIAETAAASAAKAGPKVIGKLARWMPFVNWAFYAIDFLNGMAKANDWLGITDTEMSTLDMPVWLLKILVGIANVLSNKILLGIVPMEAILDVFTSMILPAFGVDMSSYHEAIANSKKELEDYAIKTGNFDISMDEYNKQNSVGGKIGGFLKKLLGQDTTTYNRNEVGIDMYKSSTQSAQNYLSGNTNGLTFVGINKGGVVQSDPDVNYSKYLNAAFGDPKKVVDTTVYSTTPNGKNYTKQTPITITANSGAAISGGGSSLSLLNRAWGDNNSYIRYMGEPEGINLPDNQISSIGDINSYAKSIPNKSKFSGKGSGIKGNTSYLVRFNGGGTFMRGQEILSGGAAKIKSGDAINIARGTDIVSEASRILMHMETRGAINFMEVDKKGEYSIGVAKWKGAKAMRILKDIIKTKPAAVAKIIGEDLKKKIAGLNTFNKKNFTTAEIRKIKSLISTLESRQIQKKYLKSDVKTLIESAKKQFSDPQLVLFCSVLANKLGGLEAVYRLAYNIDSNCQLKLFYLTIVDQQNRGVYKKNKKYIDELYEICSKSKVSSTDTNVVNDQAIEAGIGIVSQNGTSTTAASGNWISNLSNAITNLGFSVFGINMYGDDSKDGTSSTDINATSNYGEQNTTVAQVAGNVYTGEVSIDMDNEELLLIDRLNGLKELFEAGADEAVQRFAQSKLFELLMYSKTFQKYISGAVKKGYTSSKNGVLTSAEEGVLSGVSKFGSYKSIFGDSANARLYGMKRFGNSSNIDEFRNNALVSPEVIKKIVLNINDVNNKVVADFSSICNQKDTARDGVYFKTCLQYFIYLYKVDQNSARNTYTYNLLLNNRRTKNFIDKHYGNRLGFIKIMQDYIDNDDLFIDDFQSLKFLTKREKALVHFSSQMEILNNKDATLTDKEHAWDSAASNLIDIFGLDPKTTLLTNEAIQNADAEAIKNISDAKSGTQHAIDGFGKMATMLNAKDNKELRNRLVKITDAYPNATDFDAILNFGQDRKLRRGASILSAFDSANQVNVGNTLSGVIDHSTREKNPDIKTKLRVGNSLSGVVDFANNNYSPTYSGNIEDLKKELKSAYNINGLNDYISNQRVNWANPYTLQRLAIEKSGDDILGSFPINYRQMYHGLTAMMNPYANYYGNKDEAAIMQNFNDFGDQYDYDSIDSMAEALRRDNAIEEQSLKAFINYYNAMQEKNVNNIEKIGTDQKLKPQFNIKSGDPRVDNLNIIDAIKAGRDDFNNMPFPFYTNASAMYNALKTYQDANKAITDNWAAKYPFGYLIQQANADKYEKKYAVDPTYRNKFGRSLDKYSGSDSATVQTNLRNARALYPQFSELNDTQKARFLSWYSDNVTRGNIFSGKTGGVGDSLLKTLEKIQGFEKRRIYAYTHNVADEKDPYKALARIIKSAADGDEQTTDKTNTMYNEAINRFYATIDQNGEKGAASGEEEIGAQLIGPGDELSNNIMKTMLPKFVNNLYKDAAIKFSISDDQFKYISNFKDTVSNNWGFAPVFDYASTNLDLTDTRTGSQAMPEFDNSGVAINQLRTSESKSTKSSADVDRSLKLIYNEADIDKSVLEKAEERQKYEQTLNTTGTLNLQNIDPAKTSLSSITGSSIGTNPSIGTGAAISGKGSFISQLDYKNNKFVDGETYAESGCGPAVAAMAINDMSAGASMMDMANIANKYKTPGGVSADYFKDVFAKAGASTTYYEGSKASTGAAKSLKAGQQVVLLGQDSANRSKVNSPFGPGNHYVLAKGLANGKVAVNDPEQHGTSIYDQSILKKAKLSMAVGKGSKLDNKAKMNSYKYIGGSAYPSSKINPNPAKEKVPTACEKYRKTLEEACNKHGVGLEWVDFLLSMMTRESGGSGTDPMQAAEGVGNSKAGTKSGKTYSKSMNGIKDPVDSCYAGVYELRDRLRATGYNNPYNKMEILDLAQGYNFGAGFIEWMKKKGVHYSLDIAIQYGSEKSTGMYAGRGYGTPNHALKVWATYVTTESGKKAESGKYGDYNATMSGSTTSSTTSNTKDSWMNQLVTEINNMGKALLGMETESTTSSGGAISNTETNGSWIETVKAVKAQVAQQKPEYDKGGKGSTIKVSVNGKNINMRRDCSGLVSACCEAFGVEGIHGASSSVFGSATNAGLSKAGFTSRKFSSWENLKQGDIIAIPGTHVEIFSHIGSDGTHYVWNGGSTNALQSAGPTKSGHDSYTMVWSPPSGAGSLLKLSERMIGGASHIEAVKKYTTDLNEDIKSEKFTTRRLNNLRKTYDLNLATKQRLESSNNTTMDKLMIDLAKSTGMSKAEVKKHIEKQTSQVLNRRRHSSTIDEISNRISGKKTSSSIPPGRSNKLNLNKPISINKNSSSNEVLIAILQTLRDMESVGKKNSDVSEILRKILNKVGSTNVTINSTSESKSSSVKSEKKSPKQYNGKASTLKEHSRTGSKYINTMKGITQASSQEDPEMTNLINDLLEIIQR